MRTGTDGEESRSARKVGKKSSNMHIWGCIGEKKEAKAYVCMYTQHRGYNIVQQHIVLLLLQAFFF